MNMWYSLNMTRRAAEQQMNDIYLDEIKNAIFNAAGIQVIKEFGQIPLGNKYQADAYYLAKIGGKETPICVEVKGHVESQLQIKNFLDFAKTFSGIAMLVAGSMSDSIKKICKEATVGYFDLEARELYLPLTLNMALTNMSNQKLVAGSGFRTESSIKLLFYFLTNQSALKLTQRQLHQELDVSLGSINIALKNLESSGTILTLGSSDRIVVDPEKALDKWVQMFTALNADKLLIGRFSPIQDDFYKNWKSMDLTSVNGYWSGEPATEIETGYLRPENFTIYAYESKLSELLKKLRLKKDPHGRIFVKKAFWPNKINDTEKRITPWILSYAELISSKNDRNLEAAKELKYTANMRKKESHADF